MVEKLASLGIGFLILVEEFWPLVAVPLVTEAVLDWRIHALWCVYIAIGMIGGWLTWDLLEYFIDEEKEGLSLVFGWRQRHPKTKYGYPGAD